MRDSKGPDPSATRSTLLLRMRADAPVKEIAWREFYDRYAPVIAGFARKLGAQPQDAADVVQEVITSFFAVSPRFQYDPERGSFRGYLKTCAWRVFNKRLGNAIRLGGVSLDEIDPGALGIEDAWNDAWENETLRRAHETVRERYLSRPAKARTFRAFEMFALLDCSADEVASELNMSIASVHQAKTRISRAIRAAMEKLTQDAD